MTGSDQPDQSPPDGLLVVTIDRLPAWMLPAFGCTWVSMPRLDALAARGVVLDRVIATDDTPAGALADLLGHGPAAGSAPPLLAAAVDRGWRPLLVTDDEATAAGAGPGVAVRLVPLRLPPETAADEADTSLGRLFATAIEAGDAGHRLLWCHATSLGITSDAPASFRDAYAADDDPSPPAAAAVASFAVTRETDPDLLVGHRQAFAGQLTLLDGCLGQLLETLAGRGRWSILVAGVRGLGLGLHGHFGPGPLPPFGELVHLPAILVDHRERMAAQRYGGLLVPADVGTTLHEQLTGSHSAPSPDPRAGRSLAGLLAAWQPPLRDRVVCRATHGIAVATPDWHLVLPHGAGTAALFAKPDDYFELNDVAVRCPEVAEELTALASLAARDEAAGWERPLSAATAG